MSSSSDTQSNKTFAIFSDHQVVLLLAFLGGFYDVAGYLKLKGVFTSSITGNLVVACASVSSMRGVVCRSMVCLSFLLSGVVSSLLAVQLKSSYNLNIRWTSICLFALELALLVVVWIVGNKFNNDIMDSDNMDSWEIVLVGSFMGAAMGFHNVAAKEAIPNCPPTTVMTSTLINVASTGSNSFTLLYSRHISSSNDDTLKKKAKEALSKFFLTIRPLLAFVVGAIIGAVITIRDSFWFSAVPVFIVVVIMSSIFLEEHNVQKKKSSDPKINSPSSPVSYTSVGNIELPASQELDVESLPTNIAIETSGIENTNIV